MAKLKIYEFDMKARSYGAAVQLIAAESKEQAQAMADEKDADGGEWALQRIRKDIATIRKKPYRVLFWSYIE